MDEPEAKTKWIAAENAWLDAHLAAKALRESADKAKDRWIAAYRDRQINERTTNEEAK